MPRHAPLDHLAGDPTMDDATRAVIRDPVRLEAVHRALRLSEVSAAVLMRLARLVADALSVPVVRVDLVDAEREHTCAAYGPGPWHPGTTRPVDGSASVEVVITGEAVAVEDLRVDLRFRDRPRLAESGIVAWAGVPLRTHDGAVVGALCAIDGVPRAWTPAEVARLGLHADHLMELEALFVERERAWASRQARRLARLRMARAEAEAAGARVARILESIADAFFALDREWRFAYVNREAEQIFRRRRAELLGRMIWAEFPEGIGSTFEVELRRAMVEQKAAHFEVWAPWHNAWLDVRAYPSDDGLAVYLRDITGKQRVEEELLRKQRELEAIAEHVPDILARFDRNGRYVYVNRAITQLTGLAREAVIGKTHDEIGVPAALASQWRNAIQRVFETGRSERIEFDYATPDGVRWFNSRIVPERGSTDAIDSVLAVTRDITERKRVEEAVREEARLVDLVHRTGGALAAELDYDTLVARVTAEVTALLGASHGAFCRAGADGGGGSAPRIAWAGESIEAEGFPPPPESPFFDATVRHGAIVRSDDLGVDPRFTHLLPPRREAVHVRSYLAVPVVSRAGGAHGALFFGDPAPGVFTARHERLAAGIAGWAGMAMDNARLYETERRAHAAAETATRRMEFLAEASRTLSESLDFETTVANIARLIVPTIADWCAVDIVGDDGVVRRLAVEHVDPAKAERVARLREKYPTRPDADFGVPKILRTGKSEFAPEVLDAHVVGAAQNDEHLALLRSLSIRSYLGVPLIARGRPLGAIILAYAESGRRYTEAERSLVEDLARRAAVAIENARLVRELAHARDQLEQQAAELEFQAEELRQAMDELAMTTDDLRRVNAVLAAKTEEAELARAIAEDASRAKSQFLATVSHELRTPLNAIIGYGDLLEGEVVGPINPVQRQHLGRIRESAAHLLGLINEILSLARIEAGKEELRLTEVDVVALARDTAALVAPLAARKGLRFDFRATAEGIVIESDAGKIRQILLNLLSNAVKFTDEGEIVVEVGQENADAVLRVTDSGLGIDPDHKDRIFEPFTQIDAFPTRMVGGTGLGLPVSLHLASLLGGGIDVESEPGQGSTFTLRLPIGAAARARSN